MAITVGTPIDEEDGSANRRLRAAYKGRVVDEQGRRRLHGAWRGGFSAGYYNTVGSAEGWAPSTFRSSRSSRAEATQVTPEAFMDDEDFEDANATLRTTETFTSSSNSMVPTAADTVTELFHSQMRESAGVRLLRRMGWREGSGLGAKARARVARDAAQKRKRVMGPSLTDLCPPEVSEASIVVPPMRQRSAGDTRGLGSSIPMKQRNDRDRSMSESRQELRMDGTSTATHSRFGLAAFEDGDDDIYAQPSADEFDRELGGSEKDIDAKATMATACPWRYVPQTAGVLPGFTHAATVPPNTRSFEGPEVPDSFTEKHLFETSLLQKPTTHAKDARERGAILGERQLPTQPQHTHTSVAISQAKGFGAEGLEGDKLERYRRFLRKELYVERRLLNDWQLSEVEEFETRSAAFREIPQAMRGRFTTATAGDKEVDAQLAATDAANALLADLGSRFARAGEEVPPPKPKELYRETFDWAPVPLLCRRFKEEDPYLAAVPNLLRAGLAQARAWDVGHQEAPDARSVLGSRSEAEKQAAAAYSQTQEQIQQHSQSAVPPPSEDPSELPERPSMAIFRAVFADDSDSDDSDED